MASYKFKWDEKKSYLNERYNFWLYFTYIFHIVRFSKGNDNQRLFFLECPLNLQKLWKNSRNHKKKKKKGNEFAAQINIISIEICVANQILYCH